MIARVAGIGLASPLGLYSAASLAAVRAGITRIAIREDVLGRGDDVRVSMLRSVPLPDDRLQRLSFFAGHAVDEALAPLRGPVVRPIPCVVALPDGIDARQLRLDPRIVPYATLTFGRAGFFFALREAMSLLSTRATPLVAVAAVDSLVDRETLRGLVAANRVLGRSNADGICPGEGAACVLLGTAATVPRDATLAYVHAPHTAVDPIPFDGRSPKISNAAGLASVFGDIRVDAGGRVDEVFAGVTTERFFGRELSHAYLRVPSLMPEPMRTQNVGEAFGDLGAAAGAVAMVSAIGSLRSRAPNTVALAYASSDDGTIGGCLTHIAVAAELAAE